MSRQNLSALFEAETSKPRIFPQGRLFNFYLSYRLCGANIPLLLCERGGAFFSTDEDAKAASNLQTEPAQNSNPPIKLQPRSDASSADEVDEVSGVRLSADNAHRVAMVTFYYYFPTRTGFMYFLDLYATPEALASRDYIHSHLQRHLLTARRHFPNSRGILTLAHDLHIPRDLISSTLGQFDIHDKLPGQEDFQYLYERETVKP